MVPSCEKLWYRCHHQPSKRRRYHIAIRRLAVFGHMVRLYVSTPAHRMLKQAVDIKSGSRPNVQCEPLLLTRYDDVAESWGLYLRVHFLPNFQMRTHFWGAIIIIVRTSSIAMPSLACLGPCAPPVDEKVPMFFVVCHALNGRICTNDFVIWSSRNTMVLISLIGEDL